MLVLTRRLGESIKIGDDITVTIQGATCSQVKVGIKAPKNISVHREEIYNKIKQDEAAN